VDPVSDPLLLRNRKFKGGFADRHLGDVISLLSCFHDKEIRLKIRNKERK
jgi:hypothetical protein